MVSSERKSRAETSLTSSIARRKRSFIRLRRLSEAADLSHELKRCRPNLVIRNWRIEVEEHLDISAHAPIMPSLGAVCRALVPPSLEPTLLWIIPSSSRPRAMWWLVSNASCGPVDRSHLLVFTLDVPV